jgi:starvation-inducible DNA-binding protein
MPTRNDLKDSTKTASITLLQACLTDSIDLYNATRQAHWNVKGPSFGSLHTLFETFYTQLATDIDDVAERIVQLGGTANGTTQTVAEGARATAYPTRLTAGMDHVEALLERYAGLAKTVREGIDTADEAGDANTADLLTNVSQNLDKAVWMLEAHTQAKS